MFGLALVEVHHRAKAKRSPTLDIEESLLGRTCHFLFIRLEAALLLRLSNRFHRPNSSSEAQVMVAN